jgi:UDP-N-acetylmuramoyl-L-alanyl-D-glutamate--2,6-diaminopimelate ligase
MPAIVNMEDPAGRTLAGIAGKRLATYGFGGGVDYRAKRVWTRPEGTRYELISPRGRIQVRLPLVGRFNVLNALAAQATALELGLSLEAAARGAGAVARVRGRMDRVPGKQPFLVLVDYAHTPDALERALEAARGLTRGRLTVMFGCGGDRDPGKRPAMGRVASALADRVILTSDNPRGESPEAILADIERGADPARTEREPDRASAIRLALEGAGRGDTVVLAGKGHETEQIVGNARVPFDDRAVAAAVLEQMGYGRDD